jgi:hypothetical protein
MFIALHHRKDEAQDDEGNESYLYNQKRGAGKEILRAHPEQDANIHGPLHNQNVAKGQRKERQKWDDDAKPVSVVWIPAEQWHHGED